MKGRQQSSWKPRTRPQKVSESGNQSGAGYSTLSV